MKETFYFSHDYDARKDPKIQAMLADFGMKGYGFYWFLIETIHSEGGKIKKFKKLYAGLAYSIVEDVSFVEEIMKAMVDDYELIKENEEFIWSDRVDRNFEIMEKKRLMKSNAGKLGGIKSGESRRKQMKQNEAPVQPNEPNEANKIKLNKIKLKESRTKKIDKKNPDTLSPKQICTKFFETNSELPLKAVEHVLANSDLHEKIVKAEVDSFIDYWTEPSSGGTRVRWEMQKTFEISRRLKTWFRRSHDINAFNKKEIPLKHNI